MAIIPESNQLIILSNSFNAEWKLDHEKILVEWADKAMCYRWLHSRSNAMYSTLNAWYTIPVIIISTLTGTANFAQDRVPIDYQKYFGMSNLGTYLIDKYLDDARNDWDRTILD